MSKNQSLKTALLLTTALFLAGCHVAVLPFDPAPNQPHEVAVGILPGVGGQTGQVDLCPGVLVTSIRADVQDKSSTSSMTVWKVGSDGTTLDSFKIGEAPPGFKTEVPLQGPINSYYYYLTLTAKSPSGKDLATFVNVIPSQLEGGKIFTPPHSFVSPEEFKRRAEEACASLSKSP